MREETIKAFAEHISVMSELEGERIDSHLCERVMQLILTSSYIVDKGDVEDFRINLNLEHVMSGGISRGRMNEEIDNLFEEGMTHDEK